MKNTRVKRILGIGLGSVCVTLVLAGCQGVAEDIPKSIDDKIAQSRAAAKVDMKDLSSITGDAKSITEKLQTKDVAGKDVAKKTGIEAADNKGQEQIKVKGVNKLSNKEKSMNENNGLPIDMELAKTCSGAVLTTSMGDVELEFFGDKAPTAVANFCTLAKKGFYDDVIFHRVIKDFMIQGGDPDGTGMGGPGYNFKDEIYSGNANDEYTISMANAGPNTNGSQFFINTKSNNFLDTKHTVFGKVVKGQDNVDKIEVVKVGASDRPMEEISIKNIELLIK